MLDLTIMTQDELTNYFITNNYSKEKLIEILNTYGVPYKKYYSTNKLIRLASNEISCIGIFKRIAQIK